MRRLYLLGFVRNWAELPTFGDTPSYLITNGLNGVVAIDSPVKHFSTKEEFLRTMLVFLESLRCVPVILLPIQFGMRVNSERDMAVLLRRYEQELDHAFERLSNCREFNLHLELPVLKRQTDADPIINNRPTGNSDNNLSVGQQYWTLVRERQEYQERQATLVKEAMLDILARLAPWLKDYQIDREHNQATFSIAILVQGADENFNDTLEHILMEEKRFSIQSSGPWPPYHFIPFSLNQENYLVHETLSWSERRDCGDR